MGAEAEPEAEADPLLYTTGVHAPVVASTYAHGVVAPVSTYAHGVVSPVVRTAVSPVVRTIATPVVRTHVSTPAVYSGVYSGHYNGKREAEPYTYGQVYGGLPLANAYAHNVGYTTGYGYTGYPYAHHGYGYTGHFYG